MASISRPAQAQSGALALDDIQALVRYAYRTELPAGCYCLLEIEQPTLAKPWLAQVAQEVTAANQARPAHCVNVAITFPGLQVLGLSDESLGSFSLEFQEQMTSSSRRRILGDPKADDPDQEPWYWGGPQTRPVHLLLILFAKDDGKLADLYQQYQRAYEAHGVREVYHLTTAALPDGKEHFGFRDGIAQPQIKELVEARQLAGSLPTDKPVPQDLVPAGEFILGYRNAYGKLPESPADTTNGQHVDLGGNGSYLVFRQLEQHVPDFWRYMDQQAALENQNDPEAMVRLAAKVVGRWPSGAPVVLAHDKDAPHLADAEDFLYQQQDPAGERCPIGAHIRRANPRDSLLPNEAESLIVAQRHRLLRRGRPYGPPLDPALSPKQMVQAEPEKAPGRGLCFICLNSSISRQFEFVTQTWINNPKFAGLYSDSDPALRGGKGTFTMPACPVRSRLKEVPSFVTVRGGAYFFLPGIRTLRYLAQLEQI